MKFGFLGMAGAAVALSLSFSGAAFAASQYDVPLEACAKAIQEKQSIAPEEYRQSIDKVKTLGSKYKFTLNVYKKAEDGSKEKSKFYCETKGGEVVVLEQE